MSGTPPYKIYRDGNYTASCKFADDAAAICELFGERAEVRYGHKKIVYRSGEREDYESGGTLIVERVTESRS